MPSFTMQLMRINSYFSNIDSPLYASQNKEILLIFKARDNYIVIIS
jgi:hypothetical protein